MPGRSTLWADFMRQRGNRTEDVVAAAQRVGAYASGIGTPDDMRTHLKGFQESGIDQVIFLQQAGRNRHDHICEALELFASEVMPEFKAEAAKREARKAEELAPHIAAALKTEVVDETARRRRNSRGQGFGRAGAIFTRGRLNDGML